MAVPGPRPGDKLEPMGRDEGSGLLGRWRRRRRHETAERLQAGARETAAGLAEELRHLEPRVRQVGAVAGRDLGRLVAALLLAVLGLVLALVALLAAIAFGVVALTELMPVWAAGGIGAASLAVLAGICAALLRREVARMEAPRRLSEAVGDGADRFDA